MEINIKVTVELPEWAEALVKSLANNVSMNVGQQAAQPENEDHGIRSHHFMVDRWGNSGNSG